MAEEAVEEEGEADSLTMSLLWVSPLPTFKPCREKPLAIIRYAFIMPAVWISEVALLTR